MLTLTQNASTAVRDLAAVAGLPESGGLRIADSQDQPGGFELSLVTSPVPGDEVVATEEATVILAPMASATLADQILDVDPASDGTGFTLLPQVASAP